MSTSPNSGNSDALAKIAGDLDVSLDTKGFYLWLLSQPGLLQSTKTAIYSATKAAKQPIGQTKFWRMMQELDDYGYYTQPERDHYGSVRGKKGFIYVAYSDAVERVKVGSSRQPLTRIPALRPRAKLVWMHKVSDMGGVEHRIHQKLIECRDMTFGLEWFKACPLHATALARMEVAR